MSEPILSSTHSRGALGARVEQGRFILSDCEGGCGGGRTELVIALPKEVEKETPALQKVLLKGGGQALIARFGASTERHYVVVALGSAKSAGRGPRLALKGWSEKKGASVLVQKSGEASRVVLLERPVAFACGRKAPRRTRLLDEKSGKFRAIRVPLLSSTERKQASKLEAEATPLKEGEVALRLNAGPSAGAAVDGDLLKPWMKPHDAVELDLGKPGGDKVLILQVGDDLNGSAAKQGKSPASEATSRGIWLATDTQLFELSLPQAETTQYRVPLPEGTTCAALIQPRHPLALTEVMMMSEATGDLSTEALVRRLDSSDADWAEAALGLRGAEAAQWLSKRYARLSPVGRDRAHRLALALPDALGHAVFVAELELGDEAQQKRALEELSKDAQGAAQLLARRLPDATSAGEVRLARTLSELDPALAISTVVPLLDRESAGSRHELREVVSESLKSEPARKAARTFLTPKTEVTRRSQVELLRAARLQLGALGPQSFELLQSLSATASFEESYLLLPSLVDWLRQTPDGAARLGEIVLARAPAELSQDQAAALSVRALELLQEADPAQRQRYQKYAIFLVSSENMRVRHAALRFLETSPDASSKEIVLWSLARDKWPQVRSAAALAAAAWAEDGKLSPELQKEVASGLRSRFKKDEDLDVRRSLIRALVAYPDEETRTLLRDTLTSDEDYQLRAEAARALGSLCDEASLELLTKYAHKLAQGPSGDGPTQLGLAALSAMISLGPSDLEERVAPLKTESVPGMLRIRVERRLSEASDSPICGAPQAETAPR